MTNIGRLIKLGLIVAGAGLAGVLLATDEEPAAFGRIREFSAKVRQRAMEAAAETLASEQAALREAERVSQPDLLAAFGSWPEGHEVSWVFGAGVQRGEAGDGLLTAGTNGPVASLVDEEAGAATQDALPTTRPPRRDDLPLPARHHVTLIMLGEDVARAVVDAAVVSLGDNLAEGRIVQIHSHGLVLRGDHGLVAYDVGASDGRRLDDDDLDIDEGRGR